MGGMEWLLEIVLVVLLGVTLFHAVRLERALGAVRQDRAALADMLAGFDASARQAEGGIDRLRGLADGAGRQIAKEVQTASTLRDDLGFLIERGERLADRIEGLVRAGRTAEAHRPAAEAHRPAAEAHQPAAEAHRPAEPEHLPDAEPQVRSQAERDLLAALRMGR